MEDTSKITFDGMPRALVYLIEKVEGLERQLADMATCSSQQDQWMDLKTLCNYLPMHPARQTVYGWISSHQIPYHKRDGKAVYFLKSEIDRWLMGEELQCIRDIQADAEAFLSQNKSKFKSL